MSEQTTIKYDLSPFGIDRQTDLTLQTTINGMGVDQFPRNETEQKGLEQILTKIQGEQYTKGDSDQMKANMALIENRKSEINDPLGYMFGKRAAQAEKEGGSLIDAYTELTKVFVPNALREDLGIQASRGENLTKAKSLAGNYLANWLIPNDIKSTFSDAAVIASDTALGAAGVKYGSDSYYASQIPNGVNTTAKMVLREISQKGPKGKIGGAISLVGANVAAKSAGNEFYDLLNQVTRFLKDIPNPSEAYKKDEKIRNLMDLRAEMLFSGGAIGLQQMWPNAKKLMGKALGIGEKQKNLIKQGEAANVPMNVFTTSPRGFVTSAGKVIGLFPFVATKARDAQNIQQVALAARVNKILNNLSPIDLFADASTGATKEFQNSVTNYAFTKGTLFESALEIGDKIQDQFIPTDGIKAIAKKLELDTYGKAGRPGAEEALKIKLPRDQNSYNIQNASDLLKSYTGDSKEFRDSLMNFQYLTDDFMSAREFDNLQKILNETKRTAAAMPGIGEGNASAILPFTKEMITTLNSFDQFKQLDDPAKDLLKKEFVSRYSTANEFFFKNEDYFRGPAAQKFQMYDKNITKTTDVKDPGFFYEDQLTGILLDSQSMMAPQAIKELKTIIGPDALKGLARAQFDDSVRQATNYISGSIDTPIINLGFNDGIEAATSQFKNSTYNIPILQVDKLRDLFGITNKNRTASVIEIIGEDAFKQLDDVLELADQVQQTSFGDVSEFVKRRGFLGGVSSITNLATGAFIASSPFAAAGPLLLARYTMSTFADPQFLKTIADVMNPELSDLAKRNALLKIASNFSGDLESDNVPDSVKKDFDPGNPIDVINLLLFKEGNPLAKGAEKIIIDKDKNNYATGVEIITSNDQNEITESLRGVVDDIVPEKPTTQKQMPNNAPVDPFLNVDFDQAIQQTGVGMGGNAAAAALNPEQRAALAGGNLDEAIALGRR